MPVHSQVKGHLIEESLDLQFPFTVYQFSTKEGLPQNQVVSMVAKKNGNLVISTANGIVEYNGIGFRPFIDRDEYKSTIVWYLFWHEKSSQLIGQRGDGITCLLYPTYQSLGHYVSYLQGDDLYCIDPKGKIFRTWVNDFQMEEVGHSHVENCNRLYYKNGKFYIATSNELFLYDPASKSCQLILEGKVLRFVENAYNKELYVVEKNRVYRLKGKQVTSVFDIIGTDVSCQDIAFTETGQMYVATTKGLYKKGKDYIELYNKKNGLPAQYFQTILYNQADRSLYLGSSDKGLLRLQFKDCYSYSSKNGLRESCYITSIIRSEPGEVLLASSQCIYRIVEDTIVPYGNNEGNYCMLSEVDGKIYAGTWGTGIHVLENGKRTGTIAVNNQQPNYGVHSMYKDSRGTVWIGTSAGVLKGKNPETATPYLADQLRQSTICFYECRNGNLCIGGNNGLYILDTHHTIIKHLGKNEGLKGKEVRGLYEDHEGKLWIGTYGGGIYCYEKGKLTSISKIKNAMLDTDAFCFAPDGYGYLYITSNHGLWRIKEKDLNSFYRGHLPYLVPFCYSEEEGILNTEFNGGFQNNFLKTKPGHLYFPNLQGVVVVFPEQPVKHELIPVLDRIYVDDSLVDAIKDVLPRNTQSIRLEFSSNVFLSKYNVYYQYLIRRNGQEGEWSALQKNTSITLNQLQQGKYEVSVRAIDAFNNREPKELKFVFDIQPYFYETTWFWVIIVIIFLLTTIIIGRMRVQMYRRKAEEKERYKRQLAELELKALHDRMNPHFVFNSLNSIKYYLSVNDRDKANRYLDGFSMLLRKFTEYGNQNFITVRREMEIIGTYIELEKMRMNNAFESRISIDPSVLDAYIPTITLQPFVENAIKHGIAHASHSCFLSISIQAQDSDMIRCVIEDNGIGRKRSQEINATRVYHISSGLNMVEEKKHIVEALFNIGISIEIEDKYAANRAATGTKVTIIIPQKHD